MTERVPTFGVLYPGEMGAALSALLRDHGVAVVTTLGGRGQATARRAVNAGMLVLDTLAHVVRVSDVVVSLVVPSAAEEVAEAYCGVAHLAPRDAIYVDANSIGPEKAMAIARRVARAGRSFVDGSINGLAKHLATSGTVYLSGERAGEVAAVLEGAVHARVLGARPGRASAMKMLLGGLSKGLCALFAELGVLAERQGMLGDLLEATARTYPGVAAVAERMLPTYPRHAARRHTEMSELEATARGAGMSPEVIAAVCRAHAALAEVFPGGTGESHGQGIQSGDLPAVIRQLARAPAPPAATPGAVSNGTADGVAKAVKEKTYG